MRIRLLTITHKSPKWLEQGYEEYAKRLPPTCSLELLEIPAEKRTANSDIKRIVYKEGQKMLAAIHTQHYVVALDLTGKLLNTEQLASELKEWLQQGRNIDLLIGGPDGLAPECLQKAQLKWSLSPLTFPHFLVRLIVAEQVYRAWSILQQHPYHR